MNKTVRVPREVGAALTDLGRGYLGFQGVEVDLPPDGAELGPSSIYLSGIQALSRLALAGQRFVRLVSCFVADFCRKTGSQFCEICLGRLPVLYRLRDVAAKRHAAGFVSGYQNPAYAGRDARLVARMPPRRESRPAARTSRPRWPAAATSNENL